MNKFYQFNEFLELGMIFMDCEARLIALEYFDKAIALSYLPINKNRLAQAYDQRGGAKSFFGRTLESILDFSKAIKLDPRNSYLYFRRGNAYAYLNLNEEAIKNFKTSLMLDPEFSLASSMIEILENKKKY